MKDSKLKSWISAMRLRTLPLALASTLVGSFLALNDGSFNSVIFILTATTTILLQINSNLANDFGDFEHGTDNDQRIGPERAMQAGIISKSEMVNAIRLFSFLSLFSGCLLLYLSSLEYPSKGILFIAGIAAIYASIKYTAGRNPYGYRGLGDISVVLFFGILGVVGAYYIQTASFDPWVLLPAISIGFLSAGVLNVNNTRDIESDAQSGKVTLAVRLGSKGARLYHLILLAVALDAMFIYAWIKFDSYTNWLFVLAYPLIMLNMWKVYSIAEAGKLDPWLKQLALSTFAMAIMLAIGIIL